MKQLTIDTMLHNYINWFSKFQMDEGNIRRVYETYTIKQPQSSVNDSTWHIFNILLGESVSQNNNIDKLYQTQIEILLKMLEFVKRYERRKGNDILQKVEKIRMEQYKLFPFEIKVKIIPGQCCSFCDALKNKEFTIKEYLQQQPVGSDNCIRDSGCNCRTMAEGVRDASGRLIRV